MVTMTRSSSTRFWSGVIYGLLLFRSVWSSMCHRENQYVKLTGMKNTRSYGTKFEIKALLTFFVFAIAT